MVLGNWQYGGYTYKYDYSLTDELSTDKLHFLIKIDIDDNTWDIEEILDPTN